MAASRRLYLDAVGIGLPVKAGRMVTATMNAVAFRSGHEDAGEAEPRMPPPFFAPRRRQKGSLTRCLGQTRIPFPKPRWVCLVNALIFCPEPVGIRAEICRVIGTIVPDAFNEEMADCSQFECLRASKMRGVLKNII